MEKWEKLRRLDKGYSESSGEKEELEDIQQTWKSNEDCMYENELAEMTTNEGGSNDGLSEIGSIDLDDKKLISEKKDQIKAVQEEKLKVSTHLSNLQQLNDGRLILRRDGEYDGNIKYEILGDIENDPLGSFEAFEGGIE